MTENPQFQHRLQVVAGSHIRLDRRMPNRGIELAARGCILKHADLRTWGTAHFARDKVQ